MSIQTSCLARRITIGDRTARLAAPTVRQAVEIIYVLKHQKDDADAELLFELLGNLEWRGTIDILVHLRNEAQTDPSGFRVTMFNILMQGYDPVEQTERSRSEKENQQDDEPNKPDWKRLISQYTEAYPGKDAFDVYNQTPFPFFMEMLPEARRKEAVNHIHAAFEASFGMGGSEEMMNRWRRQAGWSTEEEQKEEDYQKEMSEEEKQSNRNNLKNRLR